jgi:uncharacterized protein (DUF58 family)
MRPAAPTGRPARGRAQFRLTSEGLAWFAATIVLGGIGWFRSLNLVLILAYVMLVLLALNGLIAYLHVRRVSVSRRPLPPVYAGEEVLAALAVRNTHRRAAAVGVTDQEASWYVECLPGHSERECATRRRYAKRGRILAGSVLVWSGFPFGFLRAERTIPTGDDIIVLPAAGEADPEGLRRWLVREAGDRGRSRKVLRRVSSDHADVRGIRPYRPGDNLRAVHWRSSARRRELMVREYDSAPDPELMLVVEPFLPITATPAEQEALEAALSLAVTAVRAWCHSTEGRVTVVVAGSELVVSTGATTEPFARDGVTALADVQASATVASVEPRLLGRSAVHSARVVVSSRPNSPVAAALTRATRKPWLTLDPSRPLPWYQPPATQ